MKYNLTLEEVQAIELATTDAVNLALAQLKVNPAVRKVPPGDIFCICGGKLLELARMHGATIEDLRAAVGGALIGLSQLGQPKH
jgi:hypothetical protein